MFEYRPVEKPNYKRRVKKRADRGKFSKMVRDELKEHYNHSCQECGGKGIHIHHVCFRSQGGRGVFTNGLLVCNNCHKHIHNHPDRAMYWRDIFKKRYGNLYFMDSEDLLHKQLTRELQQTDKSIKEWVKYNGEVSEE